ncbi:Cysteine-rich receptor-like protein kinase 4 [Capsicum chinense]|nr:Cysteine-rich receptor-like protein kinase 4 [Capsicum chinense]
MWHSGYMSPEYVVYGQFSEKSDVFSFGVLLLEILTGERNSDFYMTEISVSLLGWAYNKWKEGRVLELIDPSIRETYDCNKATRSILVALLCVQELPTDRPTMSDIAGMLSNESLAIPEPKEPAFRSSWRHQKLKDFSINEMTFSVKKGGKRPKRPFKNGLEQIVRRSIAGSMICRSDHRTWTRTGTYCLSYDDLDDGPSLDQWFIRLTVALGQ